MLVAFCSFFIASNDIQQTLVKHALFKEIEDDEQIVPLLILTPAPIMVCLH